MSMTPEQQRSIAELVAQVHVDNVLQVAALLRKQADEIEAALNLHASSLILRPCGDDPVSHDAVAAFQPKIDRIVSIHWAHCAELRAAVVALRASAFGYGFTDDDIEAEFRKLVSP